MGNKVAKDFKDVKLGHGQLTAANSGRNAVIPDAVVLSAAMSITLVKDVKKKSIDFVDAVTLKTLFTTTRTKGESMSSVTTDSKFNVLFVTKAPNKTNRVIYKATEMLDQDIDSQPSSIDEEDAALTPHAKIEIDFVASCTTAFLSVKMKRKQRQVCGGDFSRDGSATSASVESESPLSTTSSKNRGGGGKQRNTAVPQVLVDPSFIDLYKAVKIPNVKCGVIIVDMRGQVVGKCAQEPKEPYPVILVAPGADAAAVVALACVVNGEL